MAHWSEDARRLDLQEHRATSTADMMAIDSVSEPAVYLFWFPAARTDEIARRSEGFYTCFADICGRLHTDSVVAILTTPPDAARLLPFLEKVLRFQLWIAVKIVPEAGVTESCVPNRHAALLILTRYRGSLRHTKTLLVCGNAESSRSTTKDRSAISGMIFTV